MSKLTKKDIEQLNKRLVWMGAWLTTYSPGDGVTRYRLVDANEWAHRHDVTVAEIEAGVIPEPDYFGARAIQTALGAKEAQAMVEAYMAGWEAGRGA